MARGVQKRKGDPKGAKKSGGVEGGLPLTHGERQISTTLEEKLKRVLVDRE